MYITLKPTARQVDIKGKAVDVFTLSWQDLSFILVLSCVMRWSSGGGGGGIKKFIWEGRNKKVGREILAAGTLNHTLHCDML